MIFQNHYLHQLNHDSLLESENLLPKHAQVHKWHWFGNDLPLQITNMCVNGDVIYTSEVKLSKK